MWVRSQHKTALANVKRICIAQSEDKFQIINYVSNGTAYRTPDFDVLGEYQTKERAIEILDEIQEAIDQAEFSTEIYEMPKE